jgi:hypothetical protein
MNTHIKFRSGNFIAITLTVAILAGCGGGSSDESPQPTPAPLPTGTAEGFWGGTTSASRTISGVVTNSGEYWFIYTAAGNSAVAAGFIQGHGSSVNGQFSSGDLRDFNFEGIGVVSGSVSSTYTQKKSLNGTVTYPSLSQNGGFTSTYDAQYEVTPTLASLAGKYSGQTGSIGGAEFATLNILSNGSFTGSSGGCNYSGSVTPHTKGNIYDLTLTFGGGSCSYGTSKFTGISYYQKSTNQIYSAIVNKERSAGFLYIGTKL